MNCGGVVLCGGQSTRMGSPKATLPFGPELMLQRVVRLLGEVVHPIVVVAAAGQDVPALPDAVRVVRDERPSRGPLEGMRIGLASLPPATTRAFVTSCDVPLLAPGFVRRMVQLSDEDNVSVAVPWADGYHQPLAAVYKVDVVPHIARLLDADRPRPVYLFELVPTRVVETAELIDVDPQLDSLKNVNQPADYLAALAAAGITAPTRLDSPKVGPKNG